MISQTRSRPFLVVLAALLTIVPVGACSAEADPQPSPPAAVPVGAFSLADDFNDVAVGASAPGWVATSGVTAAVAALPDAVDRSLRISRTADEAAARASRTFPAAAGVVEVQARVQVSDWSAAYDVLEVASAQGLVAAGIGIDRGRFVDGAGGRGIAPADPGRWYALRAVLNTASRQYDLMIDGRQVLTRAPFMAAASDVARFTAGVRDGSAGTPYVDTVTARPTVTARRTPAPSVDYLVFDQFNDDPVGSRPAGHTVTASGRAVSVVAVPSKEDRSLLLANTGGAAEATSVRPFASQTGALVVQANVRTDEVTGTKLALSVGSSRGGTATAIQFGGDWLTYDEGTTAHRLTRVQPREWYTLKLVLDIPSHQFEVYVDGRRLAPPGNAAVAPRWPFHDMGLAEVDRLTFGVGPGQAGTVRIDNVLAFRPVNDPPGTVLNVRRPPYGATGDGVHDDTAAIQRAIDDVPKGGTVFLAGGVYLTGSLRLRSDMTLWINHDAVLLGSTDDAAYPALRKDDAGTLFAGGLLDRGLVTAVGAEHVRIEGGGTIDGNGRKPGWAIDGGTTRPAALALTRSRDVIIRNIHVQNAATWAIVPDEIDGLLIADVTIDSRIYANRDGIDIVDSHAVLIERVAVSSDDDAICFKSYSAKGVDGAVVRLSTVGQSVRANGVKFGTGSVTSFRNVVVEDMLIKHVDKAAVEALAVDGGVISNLSFRRITVDDALRAIFVLLGRRTGPDGTDAAPRWVSGIAFEGLVGGRLAEPSALAGQRLGGVDYRLYNVLLSGVRQEVAGGHRRKPAAPAEYTGIYPESDLWTGSTALPARGFYLRHVNGLAIHDNTILTRGRDVRPALSLQDTSAVTNG